MDNLQGKWALVTGASRGIGREIALALAEQGLNLVVQSRKLAHTESLVEELKAKGVECFAVAAELSDEQAIEHLIKEVKGRVTVDLLFNNAGIQPPSQENPWHVNKEDYLTTYRVNVIAPLLLIEGFLPDMLAQNYGRIINTSSGIANQPEQGAYAASKGALDKISMDYAGALTGYNVTVNVLDPGWIRTDLGGPQAPNSVETVVPGMIAPAFTTVNGKWLRAQDYTGLTLEAAVAKVNEVS